MVDGNFGEELRKVGKVVNVQKPSIDEFIKHMNIDQDRSYHDFARLAEIWDEMKDNIPVDYNKEIKQLKSRVRYSKNPLEIKKLNQEIMRLQKKTNKNRREKSNGK